MNNDIILIIALLADYIIKIPVRFHLKHPVVLVGQAINYCDKKYNQPHYSDITRLFLGMAMVIIISGLGLVFASLVDNLPLIHQAGGAFLVYVLIAYRSLIDHIKNIADALYENQLARAQDAVQMVVSRDAKKLDAHGVARSALESLGENFNDAVIAPIFWYWLLGLHGLVLFKIISTMDSMVGYHNHKYEYFGKVAAIFDDILNYIPARITSGLFIASAPFLGTSLLNAWRITRRDGARHASPNAGYCEASFAAALNVQLGGVRYYDGVEKNNRYGDGLHECTANEIFRGIALCRACFWLIIQKI